MACRSARQTRILWPNRLLGQRRAHQVPLYKSCHSTLLKDIEKTQCSLFALMLSPKKRTLCLAVVMGCLLTQSIPNIGTSLPIMPRKTEGINTFDVLVDMVALNCLLLHKKSREMSTLQCLRKAKIGGTQSKYRSTLLRILPLPNLSILTSREFGHTTSIAE